ncbi:MAG: asparagine synthase (glutamine-hydrolyzing) [Bacteroidales bacterium]|nr:asparagine synthase (glutamine-hydrolyzing) [Bacteroidales bacterium]
MCGIAGGTRFSSYKALDSKTLFKMLDSIRYRGPDECGIYETNEVLLGSVRLSIIDIKSGQQPLSNQSGDIWIAYNGEVFNYIELRQELIKKGYSFKTNSDTEVIVLLYEEYGVEFLKKLNGQFAISIWDKRKKELFLARDRMGIRPLFYTLHNKELFYASEIKAFLQHPDIELKLSAKSLSQIFTFWTTISPDTAFEDVYQLPPGSYMIYSQNKFEIKSYWELEFASENQYKDISFKEAVEEFAYILKDSVKKRLRADVPVAAYLSGGLDSTVTTSLIREVAPKMLQTFSIGFEDNDYDESYYQNLASEYFDTKHTGFKIKNEEIAELFPKVIWHSEMPLLRTSPVPMYALSRKVHEKNIKVVITGEGADELLGGYNIFKEAKIRHFWAREPKSNLRPLLLKKLYPYIPQIQNASAQTLRFFFGYKLAETNSPVYSHLLRWNNGNHIKKYFSNDIIHDLNGYKPVDDLVDKINGEFSNYDYLGKAQWLEMNIFMSGYLLSSQGDRMGMANSIEGRYPFLDHRLIEFCSKINPEYKLHGLNEKYLMKKMAEHKIPNEILKRSKQAYRAPIQISFLTKKASGYINKIFDEKKLEDNGLFNPDLSKKLWEKFKIGEKTSEMDNMALTAIVSTTILKDLFQNKKEQTSISDISTCRIINDM